MGVEKENGDPYGYIKNDKNCIIILVAVKVITCSPKE